MLCLFFLDGDILGAEGFVDVVQGRRVSAGGAALSPPLSTVKWQGAPAIWDRISSMRDWFSGRESRSPLKALSLDFGAQRKAWFSADVSWPKLRCVNSPGADFASWFTASFQICSMPRSAGLGAAFLGFGVSASGEAGVGAEGDTATRTAPLSICSRRAFSLPSSSCTRSSRAAVSVSSVRRQACRAALSRAMRGEAA